jgi:hypothetical protein
MSRPTTIPFHNLLDNAVEALLKLAKVSQDEVRQALGEVSEIERNRYSRQTEMMITRAAAVQPRVHSQFGPCQR